MSDNKEKYPTGVHVLRSNDYEGESLTLVYKKDSTREQFLRDVKHVTLKYLDEAELTAESSSSAPGYGMDEEIAQQLENYGYTIVDYNDLGSVDFNLDIFMKCSDGYELGEESIEKAHKRHARVLYLKQQKRKEENKHKRKFDNVGEFMKHESKLGDTNSSGNSKQD